MTRASYLVELGFTSRAADFLGDTEGDLLTALANNTATACYQIVNSVNTFTTCTAGNNSAQLPSAKQSKQTMIVVANFGVNQLNLFPASGEAIGTSAPDAAVAVALGGGCAIFVRRSDTRWLMVKSA